jgi:hypothetical protein
MSPAYRGWVVAAGGLFMLWPAFQGNQVRFGGLGNLVKFGFTQMVAIDLQVDPADRDYPIAGGFRPFFCFLSFSIKNLPSHCSLLFEFDEGTHPLWGTMSVTV